MSHRQLGRPDLVARLLVRRRGEDLGLRERAAPIAGPPRGARRRAGHRRARRSRRSPCRAHGAMWSGPIAAAPERAHAGRRQGGRAGPTARTSGSPGASSGSSRRWGGAAVRSSKCFRSPSGTLAVDALTRTSARCRSPRRGCLAGPADLVAGTQLAAADLRGGDIHVALGLAHPAQPQEAVSLRHPVEHARDLLGLDLGLSAPAPALPAQTRPRRRRPARALAPHSVGSASSGAGSF